MGENKEYTASQRMYNSLAPFYQKYASQRNSYIQAINNIVYDNLSLSAHLVLDLGAGDGKRLPNLLKDKEQQITLICLVENAPKMVENMNVSSKYHIIQQDFSDTDFDLHQQFDCITCLWNVMGHISKDHVLTALNNIAKHLSPSGFAIIDINNRENIKQYGTHAVKNYFKDLFCYDYSNGDIHFQINVQNKQIESQVHLFSKAEFEKIIKQSDLQIQKCHYINYNTGKPEPFSFFGQLCYILKRKI